MKMLRKAGSFRGEGSFKAWMYNIARNATLDFLRRWVEVKVESVIIARINGGGSVIKLKALNGDILIRKSAD